MSSGYDGNSTAAAHHPPWSSNIMQWRNWRLIIKLTAVVLVPVIFALVLGVLEIRGQIHEADDYSRLDKVVGAAASLRKSIDHVQEERTRAADFLARGPITSITLHALHVDTDKSIAEVTPVLRNQSDNSSVVRETFDDASRNLTRLPSLRNQILLGALDPAVAINSYTEVIHSLLALDRALTGQVSSPQLSSTANAAHALAQIGEEVRLQHSLVLTSLLRADVNPDTLSKLHASEIRRAGALDEFRAVATPQQRAEYDRAQDQPGVSAREESLRLAMSPPRDHSETTSKKSTSSASPLVPATAWNDQSGAALNGVTQVQSTLDYQLHESAFRFYDSSSNLAGLETVILMSALLIAGAVVVVIARQLLGSLDLLRHGALHAATTELPQAVSDIRTGHRTPAAISPVPVSTSEEIGQVARAFDAVHAQAVGLASEQAKLRRSYGDTFINVSRRSQSLLERQLRLFEHLERYEEDPDQLATLFQLDHLATRMRRNNENLMVLAGTDLARRFTQPTTLADLIRAAVSEIEHYPRVVVHPLPEVEIVGYAASDLVRLLAELLDNAANFSAPQTSVVVTGHLRGDGSVGIDIVDRGIGMSDNELTIANNSLAIDGELEMSTSRRMGLFVAGRLATRHGIGVELHRGPEDVGIRATVTMRAELLLGHAAHTASSSTNGFTQAVQGSKQLGQSTEDTLVEKFDWEAAEQDAANRHSSGPNGQRPPGSIPQLDPSSQQHLSDQQKRNGRPQRDLFAPSKPANGTHQPPSDVGTNSPKLDTPIFDDLASAWFQASPTPGAEPGGRQPRWPAPPGSARDSKGTFQSDVGERFPSSRGASKAEQASEPPARGNNTDATTKWNFTSDDARIRAEEISSAEPTDYTPAGLPRRTPQAHLVAGSAQPPQGDQATESHRDPDLIRGRLASFQRGIREGRHNRRSQPPGPSPADSVAPRAEESTQDNHPTAQPTSAATEPSYTSAGLPRRTPRAQLVPDGPGDETYDHVLRRDADQMRGRLASFQRGVHEGRHSLREPSDEPARDN